jgi:hypothetical protein
MYFRSAAHGRFCRIFAIVKRVKRVKRRVSGGRGRECGL